MLSYIYFLFHFNLMYIFLSLTFANQPRAIIFAKIQISDVKIHKFQIFLYVLKLNIYKLIIFILINHLRSSSLRFSCNECIFFNIRPAAVVALIKKLQIYFRPCILSLAGQVFKHVLYSLLILILLSRYRFLQGIYEFGRLIRYISNHSIVHQLIL